MPTLELYLYIDTVNWRESAALAPCADKTHPDTLELEFRVDYTPGSAPSFNDPGDGGELDIDNIVARNGEPTTLGVVLLDIAEARCQSLQKTRDWLEDRLVQDAQERYAYRCEDDRDYDDYDDEREYF